MCDRNGFGDRVVLFNEWSTAVDLPEPADVVITETIGNAAIDEGIIAWTIDARRRPLRPEGLVLPQRVRMWTAAHRGDPRTGSRSSGPEDGAGAEGADTGDEARRHARLAPAAMRDWLS